MTFGQSRRRRIRSGAGAGRPWSALILSRAGAGLQTLLALAVMTTPSCRGDSIEVGAFAPLVAGGVAGAGVGGAGAAAGAAGTAPYVCEIVQCNGKIFRCGNCVDDDLDGRVDALDPECLGPCDDAEDALDAGFPGSSTSKCTMDCYFDQDSGTGNDGCEWDRRCDSEAGTGLVCADEPRADCTSLLNQSSTCQGVCEPLVPNGCDCFGCCEVRGQTVFVGTQFGGVSSCTLATLTDPLRCLPCTKVTSCENPCEECEVCVGKSELPAACDEEPTSQCPAGVSSCGRVGQPGCGTNHYCVTGCCVRTPE